MSRLQVALELVHPARVGIGTRGNTEHGFERALQMKRALAEFQSQTTQRNGLVQMLLDVAAHGFDHFRLLIAPDRFRPAAQTGTIAGSLGFIRLAKESNVVSPGAPGRARRPAINSG